MKNWFIVVFTFFLISESFYSQIAGDIDETFGNSGKIIIDFNSGYDEARAVLIQADGKIIIVGIVYTDNVNTFDFGVTRLNNDGTLDQSFGNNGKATADFNNGNDEAYAAVLQPDGKIVVVGKVDIKGTNGFDFGVARFNVDGSLDNSFHTDGEATADFNNGNDEAYSVALQPDGKLVVAGKIDTKGVNGLDFGVARFNADGSLDNSFHTDGEATADFNNGNDEAYAAVLQPDGKIVVVGKVDIKGTNGLDFGVARFNVDGSLDNSFHTDGESTADFNNGNDEAYAAVLQPDGKIVVVGKVDIKGTNGFDFGVARFNVDGSLDNSFHTDGESTADFNNGNDEAYSVALQSDGKLVVVGKIDTKGTNGLDFGVVRFNADGSLDNSFHTDGEATADFNNGNDEAYAVTIQTDTKIIVAGKTERSQDVFDFGLVRIFSSTNTDIERYLKEAPTIFTLKQNYPNPFNPLSMIEYSVPERTFVTIKLYNSIGQIIKVIIDEEKDLGNYKVSFDAKELPSGVYYYQMIAGGFIQTKKMLVLK